MDIKDFILIGGGLLIAAVVVHGFWIAWRARRDPLRMDLVSEVPGKDADDIVRLRSELPNGGARVVSDPLFPDPLSPEQGDLGFEHAPERPREASAEPRAGRAKTEPKLTRREPAATDAASESTAPAAPPRAARPAKADDEREPAAEPAPATTASATAASAKPRYRLTERISEKAREMVQEKAQERPRERVAERARERPSARSPGAERGPAEAPVEELIVIHVLSPKGQPFSGPALPEFLRANGLRYGDMNIFHRIDPTSRAAQYSVANVTEPGTFDMADLDGYRSRGVCFFMQLPGPEQPMESFEDMLKVARELSVRLGGELKDEHRSVMTGQTVEHYRQRISDFCRRRMSMRA